jgi:tricorn protease
VYAGTSRLLLVPLRADVPSPWLPESDEEPYGAAKEKLEKQQGDKERADKGDGAESGGDHGGTGGLPHADKSDGKGDKADKDKQDHGKDAAKPGDGNGDKSDAGKSADGATKAEDKTPAGDGKPGSAAPKERLKIDIAGFEHRAVLLPVERGSFGGLAVTHDGKLIYARGAAPGSEDPPSIRYFDPSAKDDEGRKEKVLAEKAEEFAVSADGRKLLVVADGAVTIRDAAPDSKAKPVSKDGMTVTVDPRAEWKEIYNDAWRRFRDWFYDPHMHGVDWAKMRTRYESLLSDCVSREDVSYVIRELISELNVGHAYYNVGEVDAEPKTTVGLLGADFTLEQGAYRIAAIAEGGPWDVDARGPLSQPGVNVKVGDWLLAVDGVPVDTKQDPWAAFQGKADRVVTLTVSDKPTLQPRTAAADSGQRDVLVKPIASEGDLRYRAWIEHNRAYVEKKSGGRVGYLHVPDTGVAGQNNLFRQFYGQIATPALIVDERWNAGGQIPTRFIELLHRPVTNMWATRALKPTTWPPDSHQGPLCMLINQRAGSGGDAFPYYFREAGLGPLIGVRTWGGLVGIGDLPKMLDGSSVSVPSFAFYENDGTWGIEGHGVDPDIEVVDDPALMVDGGDPQLDKAIDVMLATLRDKPFVAPPVPKYPDRSGMGIPDADH